jgi:N utilization substance protein A
MVMVQVESTTKKFGRIAAQTAKQVILQKIRDAERNALFEEFITKEGEVLTGTVQSDNNSMVSVSIGRAEAIMPRSHQIPGERYNQHDKIRVFLVEVEKGNKGPKIIVSRSHRNMLKRLLEIEVPEIYNGQVEIKSIAREAGYRSKVAVAALQDGIDPVGACVGMRGMRIQNIVRELNEEKIDVIEWQLDAKQFISKALSPARVTGVYLDEDPDDGRTAIVIVPDDQLSLAIGREGQNARLAAKLTGWRIDIKSETEAVQTMLDNLNDEPFASLAIQAPELVADAQRTMAKRDDGRTIMPEEFRSISRLANMAENALSDQRDAERQARLEEIEAVKLTVPPELFDYPVSQLVLPRLILDRLEPLENVGEIMWRFLIDEDRIASLLRGLPPSTFESVKAALDKTMEQAIMGELAILPEADVADVLPAEPEAVMEDVTPAPVEEAAPLEPAHEEPVAAVEADAPIEVAEIEAEEATPVAPPVDEDEDDDEAVPAAFPVPPMEEVMPTPPPKPTYERKPEPEFEDVEDDADLEDVEGGGKKKGKKKKRQLVFDENSGRVVSRKKRKGSRARESWEDFID